MKTILKALVILSVVLYLHCPALAQDDLLSFGGVWMGTTYYSDSDSGSLNTGSFFLARTPFLDGRLYFGYAISASTEVDVGAVTDGQESLVLTGVAQVIPLEVNGAYVLKWGKFQGWAGAGLNATFADASMSLAYYDNWNAIGCQADVTGDTDYAYGAQIFAGAEYIFGGVKFIGGQWGAFAQGKYQYISDVDMKISGSVQCYDFNTGGSVQQNINQSVSLDLSNTSWVIGLTYHF